MYFKYGSYQHPDNTVNLTTITGRRMYSPRNRVAFMRRTLQCNGHFCVSGQDNIKDTLRDFEGAYEQDLKDVGLYHDDGTKSAHWLSNAQSINGVRVTSMTYPSVEAEYASGRSFSLTFQADYLDWEDTIWAFQESVQFLGGTGMNWELREVPFGLPIRVINSLITPQRIIQTGSVTGLQHAVADAAIPGPLMGSRYEHNNLRMIWRGSAERSGRHHSYIHPTRYRYVFSSYRPQNFHPRVDYRG